MALNPVDRREVENIAYENSSASGKVVLVMTHISLMIVMLLSLLLNGCLEDRVKVLEQKAGEVKGK